MRAYKIAIAIIWLLLYINLLLNSELRKFMISNALNYPSLAPWLIILGQVVFSLVLLPCSIFTILSGMLWGFELGVAYSLIGTVLSSCMTFFVGRHLQNNWLCKKNQGALGRIFLLIDKYHWKASFIAYVNPLFPGSSLGFVFGASALKFRFFILGAILGTLPLQLILVFSGSIGEYLSIWMDTWLKWINQ